MGWRRASLLVLGLAAGCMAPADQRADRDLDEVGRATVGGIELYIDPGAVLGVDGDLVRLRASSPSPSITLTGSGELELIVDNLTRDAAVTGDGVRSVEPNGPGSLRVRAAAGGTVRIAPADAGLAAPFRIAFVSDFQVNGEAGDAIVEVVNADPTIEMLLCAGDIVDKGSDLSHWRTMETVFAKLDVPVYATNGNHELNGDDGAQFHARLGRMNYLFDHRGARLALVDSGSATLAERVYDYLDEELDRPGAELSIFMTHIPLIDSSGIRNGGFASHLEAERVLAMLTRRGVDLTVYGHVHSFEAFSNAGIPAYISGGGGGTDNAFDGIGDHILVLDIDPIAHRIDVSVRIARPE